MNIEGSSLLAKASASVSACTDVIDFGPKAFHFFPVSAVIDDDKETKNLLCHRKRETIPHLLNMPMQLPCGHRFCKVTCLDPVMYLQEQKGEASSQYTCPSPACSTEFNAQDIFYDRNAVLEVNNIKIKCLNNSKGCPWQGDVVDFKRQHMNNCTFLQEPLSCPESPDLADIANMLDTLLVNQARQHDEIRVMQCLLSQCQEQLALVTNASGISVADMKKYEVMEKRLLETEQRVVGRVDHFGHQVESIRAACEHLESRVVSFNRTGNRVGSFDGTLVWRVNGFSKNQALCVSNRKTYYMLSDIFHTSKDGYQLCAKVYFNGDGRCEEVKSLVISVIILQGEFDNILTWPFRKKITVIVLDQSKRQDHAISVVYPARNLNAYCFQKPVSGKTNPDIKVPHILPLSELRYPPEEGKPTFVNSDDQLFIKILVHNDED